MRSIPRLLSGMAIAAVLSLPAARAGAQCLISGPSAVCPDSSVQLCANGNTTEWSGPNGFTATTRCITVSQPGLYSVLVFDANNGLWFGPCEWQVGLLPPDSCGFVAPPPPPGGHDSTNCPRPASFWERQFRGDHNEISKAALSALGACVDARSALFAWPDARSGLASAMRENEHHDLRSRVLRQFAAVLANLCAREESLTVHSQRIGLDPDAAYTIEGEHGTVGVWAAAAEAQLLALRSADTRNRATYRRLFVTAWSLSHGAGMTLSCPDGSRQSGNDGSLAGALVELDALPDFVPPSPNPFRESTQIAFGIADPAGADVDLAVFDLAGREIVPLANAHLASGSHTLTWDGRGRDGSRSRAGVYFVHGRIGGTAYAHSVMLVQ